MILAYWILGKDTSKLVEKVKNIDWHSKMNALYDKILPYALKAGRVASRPILQFYYVMKDEKTTTMDRILIYAAIIYTISPINLLPAAIYHLLGVLDEGAAILYVYEKIKSNITDEINAKVDATLNQWFGVEYEPVKG